MDYYGPDWPAISKRIKERDGKCMYPGAPDHTDASNLLTHHIKPIQLFNGDTDAANADDNLITLCHLCHGRVHAMMRKFDTARLP